MPKSTRHKSSKHNKDATKDYSDSEKETSLKEKKSKEETRVSSDKRKEYYEEYTSSSSKRRKGKSGESGGSDRWNGKDDEKCESLKKTKVSSEKTRKRDEVDGEEVKKSSSGKSDGRHRESSRRESKEFDKDKEKDREKDRKYKESKIDKFYEGDDHHKSKVGSDKTESKGQDHVKSPGTENYTEKRSRRKKDDHGARDKHQDNSDDVGDKLDDYIKDGKQKGAKSRDKYQEDKEEDIKQKGDKQRDDRSTKEHPKSDEKLLRDESKKKSKIQDSDHGHEPDSELDGYHDRERNRDYDRENDRNERDRERVWDRDREYERDRDRDRDRERDRDRRDYEYDRYHERDSDHDRSRDRDRDHDRERTHDREKDRSRDYYHDGKRSKSDRDRENDRDVSRLDDQSGRYKEKREARRSPDYQDFQEVIMGTRSSRAESDGDMIRSERQPSSTVVQEENDMNVSDQITKGIASREAAELSGGSERGTRHKVSETAKMEEGVLGEFPAERSTATKASPRHMVDRSPSSNSLDRRYNNRSGARRSLEVVETGHRNNARDFSAADDDRLLVDETSQAELSFNNKANQNNSSFPPRPESWSGISSPRVGPREEDNKVNTGGRYKRGVDTMMGRGQGNVWRGIPSWPASLPNGFIPFQHVPPHGGFQTMMPQFPSPSLFGVRPSIEMNHQGIPYHIPDAERFSSHMRPLGWQNMMDGSGASHMHGFFGDMSNGVFRDESNMYGGTEWDHNRRMQGRGWESGADEWKTRNGDASMEVSSMSVKDDNSAQVADDESLGGQTSHSDNNRAKSVEAGSNLTSPAKELHLSSPKVMAEVAAEEPGTDTIDNTERYRRHYLSKLDISVGLADPELCKRISLLMGEEYLTIDDGTAVFVNLKEGGKRVPKSNSTSLTALSLFPSQNSSVFQIAMDLYKEQRFEGLPNVDNHGPPQVSSSNLVKTDINDAMKENSPIETSDLKIPDVLDQDASQEEPQKVLSHTGTEMETEAQDEGSSSPNPNKSPEASKVVASNHIQGYEQAVASDHIESDEQAVASDHMEGDEQEANPDDGAGVDQTMEIAPEHDGIPEADPVTLTIASPALVAMNVDERKDLPEDENMEEAEEKKEVDDGDGSVVVGNVSPKVLNH